MRERDSFQSRMVAPMGASWPGFVTSRAGGSVAHLRERARRVEHLDRGENEGLRLSSGERAKVDRWWGLSMLVLPDKPRKSSRILPVTSRLTEIGSMGCKEETWQNLPMRN